MLHTLHTYFTRSATLAIQDRCDFTTNILEAISYSTNDWIAVLGEFVRIGSDFKYFIAGIFACNIHSRMA